MSEDDAADHGLVLLWQLVASGPILGMLHEVAAECSVKLCSVRLSHTAKDAGPMQIHDPSKCHLKYSFVSSACYRLALSGTRRIVCALLRESHTRRQKGHPLAPARVSDTLRVCVWTSVTKSESTTLRPNDLNSGFDFSEQGG